MFTDWTSFVALGAGVSGLIILVALWTIAWKGYALWIASKNDHKWWFIALLVINTVAILEIIYIFAVGRPALREKGLLKEEEQATEENS